ncbi:unnamed protein product [Periconia digitata]|uniref:Uncharacterized protein n=1 Tax=Periconia digitata TaxID=1303443 RepID=A0A9W4XTA6_9PLEO|nr:unnamed protein product [Periconia digitata]
MDGVRAISQSIFDDAQKFNKVGPNHRFEGILVSYENAKGSTVKRNTLVGPELLPWVESSDIVADAKLQLVCVTSNSNNSLNVSHDMFSSMMRSLRVDTSVLLMICHTKDGFHFFPGDSDSMLPTWFSGTPRYAVLWTFDAKLCITKGIVIERLGGVFKGLTGVVDKFADYIHAPQVMCLSIPIYQMHLYEAKTEDALNSLRVIEKSIGFGPQKGGNQWQGGQLNTFLGHGDTSTIDETLALSRKVHEVISRIRNNDRLRQISTRMLEDILNASRTTVDGCHEPEGKQHKHYHALQKLSEAVSVLQQQINANANYLGYMKYRAENLSQVIVALLTHEDAAASIDLAAASKKDTSSMKTIAIMTMLFLPATFFAALFSVPLLQWDHQVVVHNKFWVYWAFTLPSTAAVFAIWLATTSAGNTFRAWKDTWKS